MPDGVIPGGPAFASATTTPATATPVSVPGGPGFSGHPQPPDVPCDPVGDDWRGPAGPPGPQGPPGIDGDAISGGPFLPLSGGTVTGPVNITPATEYTFGPHTGLMGRWFRSGTSRTVLLLQRSPSADTDGGILETNYVTTHTGGTNVTFNAYVGTTVNTDTYETWGMLVTTNTKASNVCRNVVSLDVQGIRNAGPAAVGVPLLGAVIEARSRTGLPSSQDGLMRGLEVDCVADGADDYAVGAQTSGRIGIVIALGRDGTTGTAQIAGGVQLIGTGNVTVRRGYSIHLPFEQSTFDTRYGTQMAGANAVWLATGHTIALDTAGTAGAANIALSSDGANATLTGMLKLPVTAPTDPQHAVTKAYADSLGGAARNAARLQAQWINAAVVSDDTVWLAFDAPYAGTVNSLTYFTGNGSFNVSIQINGMPVTDLGAVAVLSATPATTNASGLNTFAEHAKITAVVTGSTGSPTDALLSLAVTWS